MTPNRVELLSRTWIGQGAEKTEAETERNRLQRAVKELEALFLHEMLKEMRKTTGGEGFLGKGISGDIYDYLFHMELAKELAERGTGLGEMILRQMGSRGEIKEKKGDVVNVPFREDTLRLFPDSQKNDR